MTTDLLRRLSIPVATALLGVAIGATGHAAITSASVSDPGCHVGPAAGSYSCTVIVDPSLAPSAAPSPSASPPPAPTATPAPTPTPTIFLPTPTPSSGSIAIVTPATTSAQFLALVKNLSVTTIQLSAGVYSWDNVQIDVDRTAAPLLIQPVPGATVTFTGQVESAGVFFFGLNATAKWITMTGFTFDGYTLDQAGIFEVRSSDHVTLTNMTIRNIVRGPRSDQPYKTWAAYISMLPTGKAANSNLVIDHWTITGASRAWSGIQIDSSSVAEASIHLTNISESGLDYGFYEDVPTTDLQLNTWAVANTGQAGSSIDFHQASGTYQNIVLSGSDPITPNSSGMVNGTPGPTPTPSAGLVASPPIVVTTNNRTISGVSISSSGITGNGIYAEGTAAKPIDHLTITNCSISGFNIGIQLQYVTNVSITNCRISGSWYAGIEIFSGIGGVISGNTISAIGPQSQAASNTNGPDNNAYGITLGRTSTADFTKNPRTANYQVTNNTITDVPAWHCYDTHAGQNITFDHDTATRCMRAVFLTTDSIGSPAINVSFTNGFITAAKSYPIGGTTGTNLVDITLFHLQGGTFTGNQISKSYGDCPSGVYDYQGGSSGLTISNTCVP